MKIFSYVLGAIVLISASGAASAQDAMEGAVLYERHCATCHGLDAKGGGPMAGVLLVPPADLTRLAASEEGGNFPLLRVVRRIDGRDPLVAHGSPMPVYGDFFEGDDTAMKTASGQPLLTSRPVADLVTYLKEIQQ
ncbi:cytochrome c [Alisedimentitalea sp. MJ-SS2]|uniref:c-type cytochrome n=1 Tax=Aliisedimentitalea sp. MJ-SS2 TaxID=3049795 RepID=UPI00290A80EC|nr:cytochrome c [Alisedimentitalea sp. MJ-SS2]MDU8928878.1 cytochrome c [Alisedimentitalea sp. MJ-SS2]